MNSYSLVVNRSFQINKLGLINKYQYKGNKMKLGLMVLAGFLALGRSSILIGQSGTYCDEWNKCGTGYQCANKTCALLECSGEKGCDGGFECIGSICIPVKHVGDNGRYCDRWNPCPSQQKCFGMKCVPSNCYRDTNCATGFQCWNGKCASTSQQSTSRGYCDQWTPCAANDQCVNRECVTLNCVISPECHQGYVCYDNKYCIQVNNSHGVGRYCDQNYQCDTLHKCQNKVCVWK